MYTANHYAQIEKLQKANTLNEIKIDYTKLDEKTAREIRKSIDHILHKRKTEIQHAIFKVT